MPKKCIAMIPSIEGWHLLARLIPTIDLPKHQIFVIDQGSHDGTEQKCRESGIGCIQLQARSTFATATNRGIVEAVNRGADYVLVIHNDVEFITPVATQLLSRAETEANLGLLAPRQIVIRNQQHVQDIKRAYWHLDELHFSHEFDLSSGHPELLESDFCEFTCVLINSAVFKAIGLLDEKYPFQLADADFSYRAQVANFRCAYDQTALIHHFKASKQKMLAEEDPIKQRRDCFAADHLKDHIRFPFIPLTNSSSWSMTNEFLHSYLLKYGLLGASASTPLLSCIAHPEMLDSDYLLTVWETSQLPSSWIEECKKFKHLFVPSYWNKEVFEQSGFTNVSVCPFGVEPDLFNPWGDRLRFPWSTSILCVFQNQYRKALDVTLRMWNQIRTKNLDAFLVMYGQGIEASKLSMHSISALRMGNFIVKIDREQRIALIQPAFGEYVSHRDMAMLYRSCKIFLLNSRSEGFGYPILEAMACRSACIIPNYGATQEFIKEGNCLFFEGTPVQADYSDKGFKEVGKWWEPDIEDLCLKVTQALHLDEDCLAKMGERARQSVLSNYTWRHSMMALRKHLVPLQQSTVHRVNRGKKRISNQYRKRMGLLMHALGRNCLRAGYAIELYGLKAVTRRIKRCYEKFRSDTV